ncbi:MAG: VOC family protein [Candidatus Dormibacteraeota bacterium]|nr:VOC family protein [Candidatus Dormibacteraeota bacterium]
MFTSQATFAMYVPDVREALVYYTDKLGFRTITDRSDDDVPFATAALPEATWRFVFIRPDTHGEELAQRFSAEIGFSPHFLLTTDSLQAEVKRLEAKGVEFTDQPTLQANGMIQAHFKDLYGNVITLMSTESLF